MSRRGIKRKAPDLGQLPSTDGYDPQIFMRCHNQKDHDNETKIWKCAFEPSIDEPGETTTVLATCGGKTVCLIDVNAERVLKRFNDTDKNENFYTLAWTTIEISPSKKANILAVAEMSIHVPNLMLCRYDRCRIKLIYPSQLLMYAAIRGHKKYISCLLFHPSSTRLLFSGSRDGYVFLWDISIPDKAPHNNYTPLLKISVQDTVGDALNLVFSDANQLLIAGAERGCVGWIIHDCPSLTPLKRAKVIEKPDFYFQHPKSKTTTIDGLIMLSGDLLATKQVSSGEILIWDLDKHVRMVRMNKDVAIDPIMKLKYPQHNVKYLNLGFSKGLLGVGDDQGNLLLYNIKSIVERRMLAEDEEILWNASQVLEWPNITNKEDFPTEAHPRKELVVNTVALSSDHQFVTGGTDTNLVCIWKRSLDSTDGESNNG